jgi:hypothetical protein
MTVTSRELRTTHDRIIKMGAFDNDKLLTILLVNSLGRNYPQLQSTVHGMTDDPTFSSSISFKRVDTEASLEQRRTEIGIQSPSVALAVTSAKGKEPMICSHCKRPYHTAEFCIQKGGKMAGQTLEEARAAWRAATGRPPPRPPLKQDNKTETALVAITPGTAATQAASATAPKSAMTTTTTVPATTTAAPVNSVIIGGISYVLTPVPTTNAPVSHSVNLCDYTGSPLVMDDLIGYRAFITINDTSHASLDWVSYSKAVDLSGIEALTTHGPAPACNYPFILDSGATCHISPERSDFKRLSPIPLHPVKGLSGTCVYAIGLGDIELSLDTGHRILLRNTLFIPSSTVRLISVLSLNRDNNNCCHFGPKSCWITNEHNVTIAHGSISTTCDLYILDSTPSLIRGDTPTLQNRSHVSLHAARTPDVETRHRRLGHCAIRTVVDMARNKTIKGMPIDLSTTPPKCDDCILGKQARSPVPKARERD